MSRWAPIVTLGMVLGVAAGCKNEPALLIKATADAKVQQYDLYIRDDDAQQTIFHSGFNPVLAPGEKSDDGSGTRDLTKEPLKIAVKLSKGGKFTALLVGVIGNVENGKPAIGATQLFWAGRYEIQGATNVTARMLTVQPGDDYDGDLFPDVSTFLQHTPEAVALYADNLDLLDCDDRVDNPTTAEGKVVPIVASAINPFAIEICGDGFDEDCNGSVDEACVDQDKDGDPKGDDCDDKDAARHHANAMDPYPDPPNCCGYSLGKMGTDEATKNFTGDPLLCPKARCGDGIDESCRGQGANDPANDTACIVDNDCDGYSPPEDCNDNDPTVHPGATEICGDGINQSCSKLGADAGCVACDLDGDGYERNDATAGCPDKNDQHPGMFDCNDYDAGVYPGASAAAGGKEGGINAQGKQKAGVIGLCRRIYGTTGTTGTALVAVPGWTPGDYDCNGTAFEACPPVSCDADGDGWDKDNSCGWAGPYDCNDNDPTIFPGAPDKCSDGIDSACAGSDTQCAAGTDVDGDGYTDANQGGNDCDDKNAAVHPFQTEICNGVDDDCDGEIDEGNPDPSGNPLVAANAIEACTDSNVGQCGQTQGLCVCSHADPKSAINATSRNACPGDVSGSTTPHCFGAGQPHPQSCNAANNVDEDCDGSTSALAGTPAAMNLLNYNQACGLTMGPCKQGTMVGCDRSQGSNPWYGAQATDANRFWVCSANTSMPAMSELCNGIDDDCNGQIPVDETDPDMDHYIACSPCNGVTFASGIVGCGDCQPNNAQVNPGAHDVCNGVDDDCNPATADGSYDCTPMNKACCAPNGGNTCKDLTNDAQNCSACGDVCNSVFVNACAGSSCVCGNTGAPCGSGSYCNGNSCTTCNLNAHCGGSCIACGSGQVCKTDGSGCTGCNTDADCADPNAQYCSGGVCNTRIPKGGMCSHTGNADDPEDSCSKAAPYCTDSVCCDTKPSMCGQCKTCALSTSLGSCTNTPANTESGDECPGNGNAATCQLGKCNGNGSCNAADGAACSSPMCSTDNKSTMVDQCAGGACNTTTPVTTSCAPYSCSGGVCNTSCSVDSDCKDPTKPYCWPSSGGGDGTCYAKKTAGETCSVDGDCNSNLCAAGICCGTTSKPSSCNDTSCSNSALSTYTCNGGTSHYLSCTKTTTACAGNMTCNSGGTACQTNCTCNTSPCTDFTDCAPDYYCANNNSTMCAQCSNNTFCGATCTACNPTCANGKFSGTCNNSTDCTGTADCPNNYACQDTMTCKTTCASDTDCETGYWCRTDNTCQPWLTSGKTCDPSKCAMTGCNECVKGGVAKQCGSGNKCP